MVYLQMVSTDSTPSMTDIAVSRRRRVGMIMRYFSVLYHTTHTSSSMICDESCRYQALLMRVSTAMIIVTSIRMPYRILTVLVDIFSLPSPSLQHTPEYDNIIPQSSPLVICLRIETTCQKCVRKFVYFIQYFLSRSGNRMYCPLPDLYVHKEICFIRYT